ncbi:MAG: PKD domain-containing protein [Candidatus Poseidoniaceae archaeon]|nr:PKD domain-containing protein [Candidatus Poseidoniaceae archaeon]
MQSRIVALILVIMMIWPSAIAAESGRATPNCLQQDISSIPGSIGIDSGVCVKVDLGQLQSGDVYQFDITILQSIDLLLFDENGVQTYDLGQSYRNAFEQIVSTENAEGQYQFNWQVPASITAKTWYVILDNLAHDGDQGMGDQGGNQSQVSISVDKMDQSYWTPFHNLIQMDNQSSQVLLSGDDLKLDAGTSIVISAWALQGQADVYLQTKQMYDLYTSGGVGSLYVNGGDLQNVADSASMTWLVPAELDGQELVVIADNTDTPVGGGDGSEEVRMTVRVELAPPLNPIIAAEDNSTVAIGQSITLNADLTPNKLQQIDTLSWDFYSADGLANDDANGWEVEATWQTPGVKTVTLTATSQTGEIAQTNHSITVIDVVDPVARITGSGLPVSNGWRVNIDESISFNCDSSTDDYTELTCAWTYDGSPYGQNNSILLSWNDIGSHSIGLTVSDGAGNTNSVMTSVIVLDTTLPKLDSSSLEGFASAGTVGEKLTFTVSATDSYDDVTDLRYHWDLQPSRDTDNNGNPRDDADLVGYKTSITFNKIGRNEVVLTVFDESNNSDSHAFAVNVASAPIQEGLTPILFLVLFVVAITSAVAILGHRRWQSRIASEILLGRGLSEAEVIVHMATVKQTRALPLFASATQLAGLDAGEVQSSSDIELAEKEAELQSIYGNENTADLGFASNSGFSQAPQMSAGSLSSAAEASALLQEDAGSAPQPIQNEAPKALVESGGIALPEGVSSTRPVVVEQQVPVVVEPQIAAVATELNCVCESCGAGFEITLPAGVPKAVVACPSCQVDNLIGA